MMRGRSNLGLFLVIAGMIYLTLPILANLPPLSSVRIGPLEVSDISEFSAVSTFIGLALIAMGIFVITRRRVF